MELALATRAHIVAVLAVLVENRETRGRAIGGRFPKLLCHPGVRRARGDTTMNDASSMMKKAWICRKNRSMTGRTSQAQTSWA
jgi:hypothetical protein